MNEFDWSKVSGHLTLAILAIYEESWHSAQVHHQLAKKAWLWEWWFSP